MMIIVKDKRTYHPVGPNRYSQGVHGGTPLRFSLINSFQGCDSPTQWWVLLDLGELCLHLGRDVFAQSLIDIDWL